MTDAVVIGECMVELSLEDGRRAAIGYGGDTFNTAVYLSRLGVPTTYGTAVGQGDPFSRGMLAMMQAEAIEAALVVEAPGRLPGLYAIERDAAGERSFYYWRDQAPARDYMALVDGAALQQAIDSSRLVYVSAITLAVLGSEGRAALTPHLLRADADLVLDTNYRARLWPDADAAREAVEALAPHCQTISAAQADLSELALDPAETARRWSSAGAEVVLRRETLDVEVWTGGKSRRFRPGPPVEVVDTTGAGDSFNAGYLAARLDGKSAADAVAAGQRLAGLVVQHGGAIVPREAMPLP